MPAACLKRRKWSLGLPIHIKMCLIQLNNEYLELVLNELFIMVYYIEFPSRMSGFPIRIRGFACKIRISGCR